MTARRARAGHAEVTATIRDRISGGLKRIRAKMNRFAASSARIGGSLTAIGGSGALAGGLLIRLFSKFDDQMRSVKAISQATESEFEALTESAKKLGRETSFTASEVAGLQVNLARAGFKPDQIIAASESVLNLARATGTELPEAATIAGDVLRSFKLDVSDTSRVADVLAATANNSSQGVTDLFESLKPVAPLAVAAGDSLEELAAASGVLANNGIKGSLAGNSLARAYKNLANSATQANLKSIAGVDAVDAAGNLRPLVEIIQELGKKTANLGEAARLDAFEKLFGRGQAAALQLAKAGSGFDELLGKLKNAQGVAKETADEMDAGLGGSIRRLQSALEGVALTVGEALAGPIGNFADVLQVVAGGVQQLAEKNAGLIETVLYVVAGVTVAGGVILGMSAAATIASTAIGLVTGAATLAGGAVAVMSTGVGIAGALLTAIASPFGLVTALVVAGAAAWLAYSEDGTAMVGNLTERLGSLLDWSTEVFGAIYSAIAGGEWALAGDIMWAALNVAWVNGIAGIMSLWVDFKFGIFSVFDTIVTGIRSAWQNLQGYLTGAILFLTDQINGISNAIIGVSVIDLDTDAVREQIRSDDERFQESLNADRTKREIERLEQIADAKKELGTESAQQELDDLLKLSQSKQAEREEAAQREREAAEERTRARVAEFEAITPQAPSEITTNDVLNSVTGSAAGSLDLASLFDQAREEKLEQLAIDNLEANERAADAAEATSNKIDGIGGGTRITSG